MSTSPLQHTLAHVDCPACLSARRALMENQSLSPDLIFKAAADSWIKTRTFQGEPSSRHRYISPRTLLDYEQYVGTLEKFFKMTLREIHLGHFRAYQESRSQSAGPNKINQELGVLVRILKAADLWTAEMELHYMPLQHREPDIPRAMTPQEQHAFLVAAAADESTSLIHWYSLIALQSTASNCEMRALKISDFNLQSRVIQIRREHAKNKYRMRTIPLVTEDSLWAAEQVIARARELGSTEGHHYVFPFRIARGVFDPNRCMSDSGIKKPWDQVRKVAGVPWLRIHDLRHTAITRLAEAGTPIPVVMSMAGHISRKMMQHYTAISEQAKRLALQNAFGGAIFATGRRGPHAVAPTKKPAKHADILEGYSEERVRELARIALAIATQVS